MSSLFKDQIAKADIAPSIPDLQKRIRGRIVLPEEARYDEYRTVYHGGIDRHPAVIVRAADVRDIQQVISLARETGSELSIYSGGHSSAGYGVSDGGIMLDLRDMRALDIDEERRTA